MSFKKHHRLFLWLAASLLMLAAFQINAIHPDRPDRVTPNQADSTKITADSLRLPDSLIEATASRLQHFFEKQYRLRRFNGTVLFAQNNRVIYKGAFGYSHFRKKIPLTTHSSFQLASVSKPITAYAILLLAQRHQLNLDDDLKKYFPEFPYDDITIRLLLTHRSGMPNYMYFAEEYWPSRRIPISNDDVLEMLIKHKPPHYYIPNYRYNYCNTNYALLASIIERVSGLPYDVFMKKEIFDPLNMNDTQIYYKSRNVKLANDVYGYNKRGRIAEDTYLNGVVGDKGIYSSVEDLFKFDQAINNGFPVTREWLEKAFTPAHRDLRIWDNYGLGWRIDASDPQNKVVYHSGWWKGFRTYYIKKLGEKKTIIVLTNHIRRSYLSNRLLRNLF
ncbi:MAG: hypothetical protein Kow0037_22080 [Calditrichia bacterium]